MEEEAVRLRPFEEQDLPLLGRLSVDPDAMGRYEWYGFSDPRARTGRWEHDGYIGKESSALAVVLPDATLAGIASWHDAGRGGPDGTAWEIGVALLPEHRGRGVGTATHASLVDYLFTHTRANRLEALTDVENVAEQKTLEKVGFQREGVLRGVVFQHGGWRDAVMYGRVRGDSEPGSKPQES